MSKKNFKYQNEKEDIYKYICPYDKNHKLTEAQYERHLKICKSRPKVVKNDINKNIDNKNIDNKNIEDIKDDDSPIPQPNPLITNFNLDVNYNGDSFEKEDFIFKQCYE